MMTMSQKHLFFIFKTAHKVDGVKMFVVLAAKLTERRILLF